MKNFNFRKLFLRGLVASSLCIISCGEDEEPIAAPDASFTSAISGKTVTFTNTTVGEELTYAWDFGDGSTSTDESPEHTYEANGSYIAKLTATNTSGVDESEAVLEIINITIDGDVADWADVETLASYADGEAGSMLEVKVENLGTDKLFFYVKTTTASNGFIDLYLNSDQDATTGFSSWMYPTTPGYDILLEGFMINQTEVESELFFGNYDDATAGDDKTAWAWVANNASATFLTINDAVVSGSTMEYEFSINISEFPEYAIPSEAITFFIVDVDAPDGGTTDWSWLGNAPGTYGEETSAALQYTLK